MNSRGIVGAIANQVTMWALQTGIPRPPYTRGNAIIIETVGRRSGRRRRLPVGYLQDGGRLVVVVEDGERADWVRNALAQDGRLRVFLRGRWLDGKLSLIEGRPQRIPEADERPACRTCTEALEHARVAQIAVA